MHSKTRIIFGTTVVLITLIGTGGFYYIKRSESLRIEAQNQETLRLFSRLSELIDISSEKPYLNAMAESDNEIFDTFERWKGLDKKQKQRVYFLKDDLSSDQAECNKTGKCRFDDIYKSLQRSVETKIKSLDLENVQESNQLSALSSEMAWDVYMKMLKLEEVTTQLSDDQKNKVVDIFFDNSVIDLIAMKKWCKDLRPVFEDFARYETSCNDIDFDSAIYSTSNQEDRQPATENTANYKGLSMSCGIENKLKGIVDKDDGCPHVGDLILQMRTKHDAFIMEQIDNN